MRLAIVPKTTKFYDLFLAAGENTLATAKKLELRIRDFPNGSVTHEEIKALEREGDEITRNIIMLLNTQYITPFDRDDIYGLASAVDDVVDYMELASDLFDLYNIEAPSRQAIDQCRILVAATAKLALALGDLKVRKGIERTLVELKELEDEGDRVVRDAIAALFHDIRIDPLIVIRWKDVYEGLENAVDACERAANMIGNIAVKNA